MRQLVTTVVMALGLVAAPAASAYQFEIKTPIRNQTQVQRAISFQANRQVATHWSIDPVSFAPGGIPIYILPNVNGPCGASVGGCHAWTWDGYRADGTLYGHATIYVLADTWQYEVQIVDHEILETEVDEQDSRHINGKLVEICDPTVRDDWVLGVDLVGYVKPGYFYASSGSTTVRRTAGSHHSQGRQRSSRRS